MRLFQEDIFAPFLAVCPVESVEEGLRRMRASPYALTASVWTGDRRKGQEIARQLPGGVVSINDVVVASADPATPFGGSGDSGHGRIRGAAGLREMVRPRVLDGGPPGWLPRRHFFPYREGTIGILRAMTESAGGARLRGTRELWAAVRDYGRKGE
jgi:hypothetical protein